MRKVTKITVASNDSPQEALFRCAAAISRVYEVCLVCLVEDLHDGVDEMVDLHLLEHGYVAVEVPVGTDPNGFAFKRKETEH